MTVLVVADYRGDEPTSATRELFTAGRELADALGTSLEAVVLGDDARNAAEAVSKYVDKLYVAEHEELAEYRPLPCTKVIADLISEKNPSVVLFPDNLRSRHFAPRAAARLDAELTTACIAVEAKDYEGTLSLYMTKEVFNDKRIHGYVTSAWPALVLLKEGSLTPAEPGETGETEELSLDFAENELVQQVLEAAAGISGVDLSTANTIVSIGGGGRKEPEKALELAEELATLLGGAVGASRVMTDGGWAEHARQIGQTGQTVSPDLYIACGISGALQHVAGMKTSKVIVAINTDPEAPIFKVADYGIIGDLYEVLPLLIENLKD